MKINISEGKYSESFFKKVESFLKIYLKSEFSVHMNTSLLWIGCYTPTIDKDSFYYYKSLSIGIDKTAYSLVSDVQLHWRSPDGNIILPSDDVTDKEISFWIENMPSQEQLKKIIERNEYLWKRPSKEAMIDKKLYRFKIREMGWFGSSFPDIGIRIKTTVNIEILAEFIGNTIESYNQKSLLKDDSDENDMTNLGLVHNFSYEKRKKNVYLFTLDMGSALDGVDAILQALNKSDFEIELITLG
ncbi:hypothetical protein [Flectobacillus sp. BAB-3569]|uniref:hypothetical protein n=1 Tax=Flectobacillus sp. BAB-3569 TaxID=1509483 RepID=UPI000BA49876|nr:hypothetical protein [Flectobacillus sp. BAB-3569]PAC28171.1 hypothetical protein BWI92_20440 [Flectobacillus sp. BAB-3569]